MAKLTGETVSDGIAVMALASRGMGEYYDTVLSLIAKARECEVSVVSDAVSKHLKHLTGLASSLAAQAEIIAVFGEPNEGQAAKIEELQKPIKGKYADYCVTMLALTADDTAHLMDKMVARAASS